MDSVDKTAKQLEDELLTAARLVREAISGYREKLEQAAKTEEGDPIMVEGVTTAHYDCQLMVDPKDVARIILEYDYPTYHILGEEAPIEMWEALGRRFGLLRVSGFDL